MFSQSTVSENPRIVSERVPNTNVRDYHLDFEVSQSDIEDFWRPLRPSSEPHLQEVGAKGTLLLKRLFAIPGVAEIYIHPYEVGITKGAAFDWNDFPGRRGIESQVIETLKNVAALPFIPTQHDLMVRRKRLCRVFARKAVQERIKKWFAEKIVSPVKTLREKTVQKWSELMIIVRKSLSRKS